MKLRFKDKLDYEIIFDKELEEKLIPPFILQPLVENSIKHGMKDDKLLIKIVIEEKDSQVIIYVEDNGKGFRSLKNRGKGLSLIENRLKSLYEDNYTFNIKNGLFSGTTIEIKINSKVGELI
ncbi:ATP-binding protein [Marinitoga lauensis]|uniref:ATP-binding protein n=1 Tax=Marinitoga lauensis TaxID=2201189 RepID=UPI0019821180|nr:ATP-binding protein [Marinitoga lauensis]